MPFIPKKNSPERSEKPEVKKNSFSWRKKATEGSSFFDLEKTTF